MPDDGAIAVGLNLILCNLLLEVDAAVEIVGVALPLNEQTQSSYGLLGPEVLIPRRLPRPGHALSRSLPQHDGRERVDKPIDFPQHRGSGFPLDKRPIAPVNRCTGHAANLPLWRTLR